VNRDNVVSFDDFARGRSARRGAEDKLPFESEEFVEFECPRCAAVLCVEMDRLPVGPQVLCEVCEATIAFRAEALDGRRRR
jgi:transcription elongation factor Elf1